jgi:acetyltransferase
MTVFAIRGAVPEPCNQGTSEPITPRYPTERIDAWQLADGRRMLLRPVLAQDSDLFGQWIAGLSPQARRNRFHGAVSGLSGRRLAALTDVDHAQHVAFVVVHLENRRETMVAEARYRVEDGGHAAEFAVLVDENWQRQGIGARALHTLLCVASDQQLRKLHGSVLADNHSMCGLAKHCGFHLSADRNEPGLVRAEMAVPVEMPALPAAGRLRWLRDLLRRAGPPRQAVL